MTGPLHDLTSRNFLVRFWRGEYPLWVSFWVIGLGLYAAGVAAILGLTYLVYDGAYEPHAIAQAMFAMWAVAALVLLFHAVGVWRAASRARAQTAGPQTAGPQTAKGKWPGPWSSLAQLSVLAGIALVGVRFVQVGYTQLDQAWRMAYEDDPDIPAFSLRTMRDGTELEITGGFKYGLTREARLLAAGAPNLEVVHLSSIGGRIGEANELARLIQERGLSTYVATDCLSACTIAFIAGHDRYLKTGARLGFHRAAFAGAESSEAMRTLLLRAGIERPFVDRVAAQPATGMWYPSTGELEASHVVTAMVDSHRFAASGLGAAPTTLAFARDLRHNGVFRAFEETDLPVFKTLVDEYQQRYAAGQSEGDIMDGLTAMVALRIRQHIATADNEVLIDYANLMADQYAAIGARDARACFQRITQGASPGQAALLGAELRERETALQERALRSSVPRPALPKELLRADYATVLKELGERYSPQELALFGHPDRVAPAQYAIYCRLTTAFFRGVAALPPMRAGDVMSTIFTNMNAAQAKK
jgi:hypothetical protein